MGDSDVGSAVARVRVLAEVLAPSEGVTLSGTTLRQLVTEVDQLRSRPAAVPPPDASVAVLAERYHRSPARIREWIGAGEFGPPSSADGPYLDGREWKIPWDAVQRRDEAKRRGKPENHQPSSSATAHAMKGESLVTRQRRRKLR
jgi:hypothetical protein